MSHSFHIIDLDDKAVGVDPNRLRLQLSTGADRIALEIPIVVAERLICALRRSCDNALRMAQTHGHPEGAVAYIEEPLRPHALRIAHQAAIRELWLVAQWNNGVQKVLAVPQDVAPELGRVLIEMSAPPDLCNLQ